MIRRPSTGGTRKPERVARRRATDTASVTIAIDAYSIGASSPPRPGATSPSSRAVGAAGCGEHDGVGLDDLRLPGRADGQAEATGRALERRARWRRCGPRTPRSRRGRGQPADAADQAGEDRRRRGDGGGIAAAAARQRAVLAQQATTWGAGGGGQLVGVAGVHPAEQRLDEPVDDLVAEPRPSSSATDTSSGAERAAPSRAVRARARRRRARRSRRARRGRAGRPSGCAAAAGARRGSRAGSTRRPGGSTSRPSSRGQADRLGTACSIDSAPTSTRHPADLAEPQLAADRGGALEQQHVKALRRSARAPPPGRRHRRPPPPRQVARTRRHSSTWPRAPRRGVVPPMLTRCRARRSWSRPCCSASSSW